MDAINNAIFSGTAAYIGLPIWFHAIVFGFLGAALATYQYFRDERRAERESRHDDSLSASEDSSDADSDSAER